MLDAKMVFIPQLTTLFLKSRCERKRVLAIRLSSCFDITRSRELHRGAWGRKALQVTSKAVGRRCYGLIGSSLTNQKTTKVDPLGIPWNRGKGVECLEKATPQGPIGRTEGCPKGRPLMQKHDRRNGRISFAPESSNAISSSSQTGFPLEVL